MVNAGNFCSGIIRLAPQLTTLSMFPSSSYLERIVNDEGNRIIPSPKPLLFVHHYSRCSICINLFDTYNTSPLR